MTYLLTDDEAAKVRENLSDVLDTIPDKLYLYVSEALAILDNAKQDPLQALTDLTQEMGLYEEAQPAQPSSFAIDPESKQPAPQQETTAPDNMQDWKGMDGTTAYWLIQRHADGWGDIGKMMGEWLAANQAQPAPQQEPDLWVSVKDRLPTSFQGVSYKQYMTGSVLVRHSDRPDYPITAHAVLGEGLGIGVAIPTNGASDYPEIAWYSATSIDRNNPFDKKNQDYSRFLPKVFGSKITHWMPIPEAQPVAQPVAYMQGTALYWPDDAAIGEPDCEPLYAAPIMHTNVQNLDTSQERVQKKAESVQMPPFPEADLTGVSVCCGEYARCGRPCTPRGRWQGSRDSEAVNQMLLEALKKCEELTTEETSKIAHQVFYTARAALAAIEKAEGDVCQSENCTCVGFCTGACKEVL